MWLGFFPAVGSISKDLQSFFLSQGISSNITNGGAYRDQAAGYYTGGSLSMRNGNRVMQPATVQMPGFRGGCGGIDLWMGGFSHISGSQLVEMLRNIGSSAASYAFMLAVQTVSPQIYNIMNELNALASQINQTNINSCEAAATMLGGMWPKSDQASKHLCQAMGTNLGAFSDYSAARHGCGAKGDREKILNKRSTDPQYKDMLAGEFNLSWQALLQNSFLSNDKELAQLFLTLVGSIIHRHGGNNLEVVLLPSAYDQEEVLNGLLNGGNTRIYHCDTDKCLKPTLKNLTLSSESALLIKVQKILDSLVDKIYQDTDLSKEEQDFLNSTSLPLYKMLNVISAYRKGAPPLDVQQYAQLIAWDILYQYLLEVMDLVYYSIAELRAVQVNDRDIQEFLQNLNHARSKIVQKRGSAYQQMDANLNFIQATRLIEKQLWQMTGALANEYNWF